MKYFLKVAVISLILLSAFRPISWAYPILPLVKCYERNIYQAGRQNWAVASDSKNTQYFGNNEGLLHYSYGVWELFPSTKNDQIRSLSILNDTIWAAGDLEYGYYARNEAGKLLHHHLGDIPAGQVWKIEIVGNKVHFQTQDQIFIYNKQSRTNQTVSPAHGVFNITKWKESIYVLDRNWLLSYVDKENKLVPVADLSGQNPKNISAMFVHRDQIYMLVAAGYFLVYKEGEEARLEALPEDLKSMSFFSAISYNEETIALGSISSGLVFYNDQLRSADLWVNESHGLIENTVLSIGKAKDGKLWLGLDYGLACVEPEMALSTIFNRGATYDIFTYNGTTYLATNKGLFYSSGTKPFEQVAYSQGQNWAVRAFHGEVYACHNNGLFRIEDKALKPIFESTGVLDLVAFKGTNKYIVSLYTGLFLAQYDHSGFQLLQNLNYWGNPKIAYDTQHKCVWAKAPNGDLLAYTLNTKGTIDAKTHKNLVDFFDTGNELIFYDGYRLRRFQEGNFSVIESKPYKMVQGSGITRLAVSPQHDKLAFVKDGKIDLLIVLPNGDYRSFQELLQSVQRHLVKGNEQINFEGDVLRIATDRGVDIFNTNFRPQNQLADYTVVSKISANYGEGEVENRVYPFVEQDILFSKSLQELSFSFGTSHGLRDHVEYRYQLWPLEQVWTDWSKSSTTVFHRLRGGEYILRIQSRINGLEGSEGSVQFTVEKDFTQTALGGFLLFMLVALLLLLAIYLINRRYKREYLKETAVHKERYAEKEVALKNEQLLKYVELINRKNALLRGLKEDLADVRNKMVQLSLQKIDAAMEEERKTYIFDQLFSDLHHDFLLKLGERIPDLTTTEIRLISLIRFNLKNDEIANLMYISPKSVAVNRYRLRKKIGIEHDQDLDAFIRNL